MEPTTGIENQLSRVPRWLWHTLFWVVFMGFFIYLYGTMRQSYGTQAFIEILHVPEKMAVTYFTLYFLLPKYLMKGRYVMFTVLMLVGIQLAAIVNWTTTFYIEQYALDYPSEWFSGSYFQPLKMLKFSTYVYPVVAVALLIKLAKNWYRQNQNTQRLQQEKLESELKFLKGQIHPHFLFNTLNNLYALTLKKDDRAPDLVLKLSQLLDYMLYECNAPEVALSKEIELVSSYIELEKVRYGDRLVVNQSVKGPVQTTKIPPLLILPLIENSFKHGLSATSAKAELSMSIEASDEQIKILVSNSKMDKPQADKTGYKQGIGQKNVQRRLELLYPGRHEFRIEDKPAVYQVEIVISNS